MNAVPDVLCAFCRAFRRAFFRISRWRPALLALGLGWCLASPTQAAPMHCGKGAPPRTPLTEMICNDADLPGLDTRLDEALTALQARQPRARVASRQAHLDWLAQRDACGTARECLVDVYVRRLEAVSEATAVPFDAVDARAARTLQQALARERRANAEMPLANALKPFVIAGLRQPARRGRSATYAPIDLDGDQQQDLILEQFEPGSGLLHPDDASSSSHVDVVLNKGPKGSRRQPVLHRAADDPASFHLYTLDGWSNQRSAHWVRLQGRVYVVFVESEFGRDTVRLLRPAAAPSVVAQWTLAYKYRFTVPTRQSGGRAAGFAQPLVVNRATLASLQEALRAMAEDDGTNEAQGSCPGKAEGEAKRPDNPAGPSIGKVFVVWLGPVCRTAALRSLWSSGYPTYDASGWTLEMFMSHGVHYEVHARRQLIRLERDEPLKGPTRI
jgi:uncharacterized protein